MATRRRIGVSAATTEAARRQLMQPVPCWEKVWVTPSVVTSGSSSLKVYKWIKTEKTQQFSDDEDEADEPLAPLPDEAEVIDGDDEEADEARTDALAGEAAQPGKDQDLSLGLGDLDTTQDDPAESKVPSPKPQLMMLEPSNDDDDDNLNGMNQDMGLDVSLKPMDRIDNDDGGVNDKQGLGVEELELDISGLGPDGLELEGADDLSQLEGADGLIGGSLMDESGDPFVGGGGTLS